MNNLALNVARKPRVLVIDDEMSARVLAQTMLEGQGCEVVTVASSFVAGWELKVRYFDLIVLDWHMPKMSGAEFLLWAEIELADSINFHKGYRRIPLVVYSGVSPETIELPHVSSFQLVDYWHKGANVRMIGKRASNLIYRLSRRLR